MHAVAKKACDWMKVLSNPARLLILCQLSQQEMCVSDLNATRREGRNVFCELDSAQTLAVINTLYQHFCANKPTRYIR
ncbi:MAG: transcriptional regulator [Gammaproteobacteria bacterium]|nr:transcriptional regulator [Gammaproteobacteria bacterium]